MPQIGDKRMLAKYSQVWAGCVDCGKERWVQLHRGLPISKRCRVCAAKTKKPIWSYFKRREGNIGWKGGRRVDQSGYIKILVPIESPYYSMIDKMGYVSEHRLVMAQYLGRSLSRDEIVHHKNQDKHDNKIDNLVLSDRTHHYPFRHYEEKIKSLEKEILRLKSIKPSTQEIKVEG